MRGTRERLGCGGVAKQAEAEAAALAEALGEVDVATKRDLKELELKITGELTLIKWMLGILLGGVIALIMKAFFPA